MYQNKKKANKHFGKRRKEGKAKGRNVENCSRVKKKSIRWLAVGKDHRRKT